MEFYEECAKNVAATIHDYHVKGKEIADAYQKVMTDEMYSEVGKKRLTDKLLKELAELTDAANKNVVSIIKDFCKQYTINRVDEKADQVSVSNALKVIEMTGDALTPELLRGVLEPIRKSHSSLRMIGELIHTKHSHLPFGFANEGVIEVMDEFLGASNSIFDYEVEINEITGAMNTPSLFNTGISGISEPNGRVINRVTVDDTYTVLALADHMMSAGALYDRIRMEYPEIIMQN